MGINDYIGKEFNSKSLGKVKVLGRVPKSKTLLEVECLDKGKGFDKKTQTYKGVKSRFINKDGEVISNWSRAENREFGTTDVVHKNDLN